MQRKKTTAKRIATANRTVTKKRSTTNAAKRNGATRKTKDREPLDPVAVRRAAFATLKREIEDGTRHEFRFRFAEGEPTPYPPELSFATLLLHHRDIESLCAMSNRGPQAVRGALVELAMGATSPSWGDYDSKEPDSIESEIAKWFKDTLAAVDPASENYRMRIVVETFGAIFERLSLDQKGGVLEHLRELAKELDVPFLLLELESERSSSEPSLSVADVQEVLEKPAVVEISRERRGVAD